MADQLYGEVMTSSFSEGYTTMLNLNGNTVVIQRAVPMTGAPVHIRVLIPQNLQYVSANP